MARYRFSVSGSIYFDVEAYSDDGAASIARVFAADLTEGVSVPHERKDRDVRAYADASATPTMEDCDGEEDQPADPREDGGAAVDAPCEREDGAPR